MSASDAGTGRWWIVVGLATAMMLAGLRLSGASLARKDVLPPSKQADELRMQASRVIPDSPPAEGISKDAGPPAPTPYTWPTGIFQEPGGYPPEFVTIENEWQGVLDGQPIQVYAGADRGSKQGYLVVIDRDWEGGTVASEVYESPKQAGALQVVEVRDSQLTAAASDGTIFVFDLKTRSFT